MSSTIKDVAKRAGVSISTVSRVLNGTAQVRSEKKAAVERAAHELGYSPNPAALSLLNKKTGGIGVLLPFVGGEFFADLLNGLDKAAQESGVFLVVSTSHRRRGEFNAAIQAMQSRVDGLIVMAPEIGPEGVAALSRRSEPLVFINTRVDGRAVDALNFDNYGGALALVRHLASLGHSHIAHIRGPADASDAQERVEGYRAGMRELGVEDTSALEYEGEFTNEAGYEATRRILEAETRPTAIMAANDSCATGVLSALNKAGLSVPGDVAVTGFDGISSGHFTLPPLTTVRLPTWQVGYEAIRRIVARLHGRAGQEFVKQVLPGEVVARESTLQG
jgi:LacI family transcriptional regulator